MSASITKKELQQICQEVLTSANFDLKRYKLEKANNEDLDCDLLSSLLYKLRINFKLDPKETLKTSSFSPTDHQAYLETLQELLNKRANFDYMKVIQEELLAKAQKSWLGSITKLFQSK